MRTPLQSSIGLADPADPVNNDGIEQNTLAAPTGTPDSLNTADDLDAREDRLLRIGNGIRDAVVFPRLRAMGVAEADLHRAAMRLVRHVQYGLDRDGTIAAFLGVIRLSSPAHGTIAASEGV